MRRGRRPPSVGETLGPGVGGTRLARGWWTWSALGPSRSGPIGPPTRAPGGSRRRRASSSAGVTARGRTSSRARHSGRGGWRAPRRAGRSTPRASRRGTWPGSSSGVARPSCAPDAPRRAPRAPSRGVSVSATPTGPIGNRAGRPAAPMACTAGVPCRPAAVQARAAGAPPGWCGAAPARAVGRRPLGDAQRGHRHQRDTGGLHRWRTSVPHGPRPGRSSGACDVQRRRGRPPPKRSARRDVPTRGWRRPIR
jgi:hypothetical protein